MIRSRLWLLAAAPILAVAIVATQHFALAHSSDSATLRGFATCGELHEHYVKLAVASAQEEQYAEEEEAEEEAMADDGALSQDSAEEGAAEFPATGGGPDDQGEVSETGTNVQERGVDESDIIKTDGTHFYILRPQSLLIAEISEDGPSGRSRPDCLLGRGTSPGAADRQRQGHRRAPAQCHHGHAERRRRLARTRPRADLLPRAIRGT